MNRAPGFAATFFPADAAFRRALFLRATEAVFGLGGTGPLRGFHLFRLATPNAA